MAVVLGLIDRGFGHFTIFNVGNTLGKPLFKLALIATVGKTYHTQNTPYTTIMEVMEVGVATCVEAKW